MKFQLTEPNKQYSNAELIADLQHVTNELGKNTISQREYNKLGQFSYQTLKKRFGSWKSALKEAGLEQSKRSWGGDLSETRIPEEQLISDMQRVAGELKKQAITIADYDEYGKFGSSAICKRFGGWNKAKEVAKLKIGRVYNSTDEDYFENIADVWGHLGRQPKYQEMTAPLSKLNISSYERKFGTWRNALERFVEYINSKDEAEEPINTKPKKSAIVPRKKELPSKKVVIKKRTNRIANLRQRFRVMKRDGFKCVLCGSSPATQISCELHIDHIIPWSKGGETVEENLRTLCSSCNLGRSNKE